MFNLVLDLLSMLQFLERLMKNERMSGAVSERNRRAKKTLHATSLQRNDRDSGQFPIFQRGLGGFSSTGRIYDPLVGQFMQADNYIQTPEDYIGYNRYSYCRHNPFKYVDPSGEQLMHSPGPSDGTCYDLEATDALIWAMISVEAKENSYEMRYRNAKGELSITTFTDSDLKTAIDQKAKKDKDGTISNREQGTDNNEKSSANRTPSQEKKPITEEEKTELLDNADKYNGEAETGTNSNKARSFLENIFNFDYSTSEGSATARCPSGYGYDCEYRMFVDFSMDNDQLYATLIEGVTIKMTNSSVYMFIAPGVIYSSDYFYQMKIYTHELIHFSQYRSGRSDIDFMEVDAYRDDNKWNDNGYLNSLHFPRKR